MNSKRKNRWEPLSDEAMEEKNLVRREKRLDRGTRVTANEAADVGIDDLTISANFVE